MTVTYLACRHRAVFIRCVDYPIQILTVVFDYQQLPYVGQSSCWNSIMATRSLQFPIPESSVLHTFQVKAYLQLSVNVWFFLASIFFIYRKCRNCVYHIIFQAWIKQHCYWSCLHQSIFFNTTRSNINNETCAWNAGWQYRNWSMSQHFHCKGKWIRFEC